MCTWSKQMECLGVRVGDIRSSNTRKDQSKARHECDRQTERQMERPRQHHHHRHHHQGLVVCTEKTAMHQKSEQPNQQVRLLIKTALKRCRSSYRVIVYCNKAIVPWTSEYRPAVAQWISDATVAACFLLKAIRPIIPTLRQGMQTRFTMNGFTFCFLMIIRLTMSLRLTNGMH